MSFLVLFSLGLLVAIIICMPGAFWIGYKAWQLEIKEWEHQIGGKNNDR